MERTHRIGQVHKTSWHYPCPLIVTFSHGVGKLSILRDSRLREDMRRNGMRVAADLTPRQRDQLQHYKEQGQVAYYKNGRLHVETWRRDYTDSHPWQQAAYKNDKMDYIHGEREQPYAQSKNHCDEERTGDQCHTDIEDRNSRRNMQDRRGGFHDPDSSQHLYLPDDSRRQRDGSVQHGDQHFSQASGAYNIRNTGEGISYREGAASLIKDYDLFYSAEEYSMVYNIPPALWTSDSYICVNPPMYPSRTTFLSTPLPQFPKVAEHPLHCQSLLSPRGLQLHGTLPHHPTRCCHKTIPHGAVTKPSHTVLSLNHPTRCSH